MGPAVRTGFPGRNAQNVRWRCSRSLSWPCPLPTPLHSQPSGFPLINEKVVLVGERVWTGCSRLPQGPAGAPWVHLETWGMTWSPSGLTDGPPGGSSRWSLSADTFQAALEQGKPSLIPGCPAPGLAAQRGLGSQALSDPTSGEAPKAAVGGVKAGAPQAWALGPGVSQDFRGLILCTVWSCCPRGGWGMGAAVRRTLWGSNAPLLV